MVFGEENPAKMLERNKVYLKEEAIKRKKEKTNKEWRGRKQKEKWRH